MFSTSHKLSDINDSYWDFRVEAVPDQELNASGRLAQHPRLPHRAAEHRGALLTGPTPVCVAIPIPLSLSDASATHRTISAVPAAPQTTVV